MIYLTGSSNHLARRVRRADLGLLGTPAGSTVAQRGYYPTWAADNGCYGAPAIDARTARYGPESAHVTRWADWLANLDPTGARFATLPDVVGDPGATHELSSQWVSRVRHLGFPVAWVMQDGIEADSFRLGTALNAADVIFLGGSTAWKLGPAAAEITRRARARGLDVHMGRVNSRRRLHYAAAIGCTSCDGTYFAFGPDINTPKMLAHLDALELAPTLF